MKILVLNPPFKTEHGKFSTQSRSPSISKGGTVYYPYFLAHAVGVLEQDEHEVEFMDTCADQILRGEIHLLLKWGPELIVIGTTTPSIYEDIKTAESLKKEYPNSFIILVGPHVSILPSETLKLSNSIDAIAIGEYDYTIRDLAKALEKKISLENVDGIIFRRRGIIIHNKPRTPIENLDKLPFVSKVYKKHLNIKNYFFAASDYPVVQIITGRGCSWGNCTFCQTPVFEGKQYRTRSVIHVVDELEWIKHNLPEVKEVGIEDGTFGPDGRIREICREIIARKLKIKWYCNVRTDLKLKTMVFMKHAGCHLVTVGFESANQQILKNIKKGTTISQIEDFVKNTKKAGLLVHGCFMSGNPGDTPDTLKENLKLAKELNCDTMQFFPLMVYPGTEAYNWAKENNYIIETKWDKWVDECGQYNTVISLPNLSRDELVRISNESVKKYHTRPSYIFYKIRRVLSHPDEFVRTFKGFKSFVKRVLGG